MSNILDSIYDQTKGFKTMDLRGIGSQVRARRSELGLSQERLAKLGGLSRATINQLEMGTLKDLGVAKLAVVMELVGLHLSASQRATSQRALLMASRTASVSYKLPLQATQLAQALASGKLPPPLLPHMATLLDEAPLPLLVSTVAQAAELAQVPPKKIWRNLFRWAQKLRSPRAAWA